MYENVNPRMKEGFRADRFDGLDEDGAGHPRARRQSDIYVNVMERELKRKPDAKLEVHNEYIDIQVLVTGKEESSLRLERAPGTETAAG